MAPFRQPRVVIVPPSDVTLSQRLFDESDGKKLEARIKELTQEEERLEAFAKTDFLTLPFRQGAYWTKRTYMAVKSALISDRFHHIHIKGYNRVWKLNNNPVLALDGGKALDNLVRIKIA